MVLVSLLMTALVLLVGCAPRATSGQIAAAADESQIAIDLPALVLDVQNDGSINIGGQSLAELGGGMGAGLAGFAISADMVQSTTLFNIQHIQIDNTPEGLLILINGQAIPSLAWDGEKLVATAEVLEQFGAGVALLDRVLPLVTNIGVGVILRFPVAEGEAALPLVAPESEAAAAALAAQQEFLNAVGAPPVIHVTIAYAEDGSWAIANMDQAALNAFLPGLPLDMLNLGASTVQSMSAQGISEIGLATNADGIFMSINNRTLPYLTWGNGRVNHLLGLVEDSGLLAQFGSPDEVSAIVGTIESLLPAVQASDVSLRVTFP